MIFLWLRERICFVYIFNLYRSTLRNNLSQNSLEVTLFCSLLRRLVWDLIDSDKNFKNLADSQYTAAEKQAHITTKFTWNCRNGRDHLVLKLSFSFVMRIINLQAWTR